MTAHNAARRHAFISIVASLALVVAMFPMSNAYGVTSSEVTEQANQLMTQIDEIQTQIGDYQKQYDEALEAYDAAMAKIDEAQVHIDTAEKRMSANKQKLSNRAVALYRSGSPSMLDVLLGSNSFEEFATMTNALQIINENDQALIEESRAAKAEAQAAKEELEVQKEEASAQMEAADTAKSELETKQSEIQAEVNKLTAEAAELQAAEEAASASSNYSATEDVIVGNGQFCHPCPGYSYISSTFGYRTYDNAFHKGMDFAASTGTPIYAADAGTVVIAGYSSSAGNWVVISHGNGLTTKYMHMNTTPFVSAGQAVSRGQNIGVVGTTGNSSGPHLHFQVELNGSAVNPAYYL